MLFSLGAYGRKHCDSTFQANVINTGYESVVIMWSCIVKHAPFLIFNLIILDGELQSIDGRIFI